MRQVARRPCLAAARCENVLDRWRLLFLAGGVLPVPRLDGAVAVVDSVGSVGGLRVDCDGLTDDGDLANVGLRMHSWIYSFSGTHSTNLSIVYGPLCVRVGLRCLYKLHSANGA